MDLVLNASVRGKKYDVVEFENLPIEDKRAVVIGLCRVDYLYDIEPIQNEVLQGAMDDRVEHCIEALVASKKRYDADSDNVKYACMLTIALASFVWGD